MNTFLLFVYGTLRAGQSNHYHLAGAEFVGAGWTDPSWELRTFGMFPAVFPGTGRVRGEVYRVPESMRPTIEDLERWYDAATTTVQLDDGSSLEGVTIYCMDEHTVLLVGTGRRKTRYHAVMLTEPMPSGDWTVPLDVEGA